MNTPVRVVLAADENFARPLAVTARSIIANFVDDRDLELFVIDMGIAPETRDTVAASLVHPRTAVNWVTGADELVAGLPTVGWFTTAVYARVLIPDLLPADVARVVYLDSDVVVRKSVDTLFDSTLGDHLGLAAPDQGSPFVSSTWGLAHWYDAGRAPDDHNFNTGVMVMNLEGWRREGVRQQALDYARSDRYWRNVDQEAINAVAGTRFGTIDARWNVQGEVYVEECAVVLPYSREQVEAFKRDPWLIHYSLGTKPWMRGCPHPWVDEWFKYLDQTAFAGWRPPQPPVQQRLFSAARRAGSSAARRLKLT